MRIAIVGGGATGSLAAVHLATRLQPTGSIQLIEPNARPGRGVAYAGGDPAHLLNVRVANMSAFPEQPAHFLDWLATYGHGMGIDDPAAADFVPRSVYGSYVESLVGVEIASGRVAHVQGVCTGLEVGPAGAVLHLDGLADLGADCVVLATGNEGKPRAVDPEGASPWSAAGLDDLDADAAVLLVGTGLTAIDVLMSLSRRGHRGPVTALSRHGLLPAVHRLVAPAAIDPATIPFGRPLSQLLRWIRGLVQSLPAGGDWRAALDGLRPYTQRLWQSMSTAERRRFLRHARAWWDVHRHRMAPAVAAVVMGMRQSGQLEILAGEAQSFGTGTGRQVTVLIRRRGGSESGLRRFDRVIECTGLADDPHSSANPLILSLLAQGLARLDAAGVGLDISPDFRLIGADGTASPRLCGIGPLARAAFWECVAIPDIRTQCRDLAVQLAGDRAAGR